MKNWSRQLLSVLIMTGSLSALPATAQVPLMDRNAQAPLMRLVNVRAEATREVANDQMEAQVYTELSNSSAAALATQINQTINRALTLSRKYPQVKVSTGSQNTYPVYDDRSRKLQQWRGRAQLNLRSTDFAQMSALIAELQQSMLVENINFTVSPELRQRTENELLADATRAFRNRAGAIQQIWGAGGFELVNIDYNSDMPMRRPPIMMARMANAEAGDVVRQEMQGGESSITLVASGVIQLR